jgi:hypothetical protein
VYLSPLGDQRKEVSPRTGRATKDSPEEWLPLYLWRVSSFGWMKNNVASKGDMVGEDAKTRMGSVCFWTIRIPRDCLICTLCSSYFYLFKVGQFSQGQIEQCTHWDLLHFSFLFCFFQIWLKCYSDPAICLKPPYGSSKPSLLKIASRPSRPGHSHFSRPNLSLLVFSIFSLASGSS